MKKQEFKQAKALLGQIGKNDPHYSKLFDMFSINYKILINLGIQFKTKFIEEKDFFEECDRIDIIVNYYNDIVLKFKSKVANKIKKGEFKLKESNNKMGYVNYAVLEYNIEGITNYYKMIIQDSRRYYEGRGIKFNNNIRHGEFIHKFIMKNDRIYKQK